MTDAAASQDRSPNRRLQSIDALRGLAVILVVLLHIDIRFRINHYDVSKLLPEPIGSIVFDSGYYSVITFFVISGFLITSLSLRRWQSLERISLPSFYALRAARILPCLLLLLIVLSVLHLANFSDFAIKPERASLPRAIVAALTFHFNWLEGQRGYLPGNWDVLWSLSVEELFYVLFPLACLALRRERWIVVALITLIIVGPFNRVAIHGRSPWNVYAYLSCMDGIAFGCLAAWLSSRLHWTRTALRISMSIGVTAIALIVVFRTVTSDLGLMKTGLNVTLLEMGVALVLLALSRNIGNNTLAKGTSLIQLVGRSSYEIYLTHMFVVLGLMHPFKAFFGKSPSTAAYSIAYATMLALSIVLGYAVARWYSEPLNSKLRKQAKAGSLRTISSGLRASTLK